jgi:acetyl esterase/lipase
MSLNMTSTHMIVLPCGGYAEHAPHEAEPVARWLGDIGVHASVFRYPLNARHPVPLNALRGEIARQRARGAQRIGLIGFSAGGHLAGLAALAPGATPDETVHFAVLGYAITSIETETYGPAREILLGEDASSQLRRSTSLDSLVTPDSPPFSCGTPLRTPTWRRKHAYRLATALAAGAVPHAVHVFAHGPHSLGLAHEAGEAAIWTTLARAGFMNRRHRRMSSGGLGDRRQR